MTIFTHSNPNPSCYTGRFAPSPTGPLHFGSLVSALASFLDARAHGGRWLVRIEDLDPPREQPGATDSILDSLRAHGLQWDDKILFQSQRLCAYRELIETLVGERLAYPCDCSRQDIQATGGSYSGRCRNRTLDPEAVSAAIRLKVGDLPPAYAHHETDIHFDDIFQGRQRQQLGAEVGDFVIQRKDRLFAYQLAVVVDDISQGVTHVIRGSDLLDSTARQIFLFRLLAARPPVFGHIPVVTNPDGQKLSKQNGAQPIASEHASRNLYLALQCLKHCPPAQMRKATPAELLAWGVANWRRRNLPGLLSIDDPTDPVNNPPL